jgi:hypothetical protein
MSLIGSTVAKRVGGISDMPESDVDSGECTFLANTSAFVDGCGYDIVVRREMLCL